MGNQNQRGSAVVVGSGISGMLAAAALRAGGFEATMVEQGGRDAAGPHPASPQDVQLHNVLGRAQRHLVDLLPGFRSRFLAAGGCVAAAPARTHVFELGVRMPERELGLEIWSAPKPVVSEVVRAALDDLGVGAAVPGRVVGLVVEDGRCRGVDLDAGSARRLTADLVLDASGAASQATRWLMEAGCPRVPVTEYKARQWYTTVEVERPEEWVGHDDFWLVFPHAGTRGGLVSPLRSDRWVVSVSGSLADEPPGSYDDLVRYAGALEDPWISECLQAARQVSEPRTFHKPVAVWRRYDQLASPLLGFLPIGDALCGLNPLYGQGISVAAWEAAALRDLLVSNGPDQLTAAYLERAAAAVGAAWALMTMREPTEPSHVTDAELQQVREAVCRDPQAQREYVEIWHLLRPANWLHEHGMSGPADALL